MNEQAVSAIGFGRTGLHPAGGLSDRDRVTCACLAIEALRDLYDLIPAPKSAIIAQVADEFADEGGELSGAAALVSDGEVQGVLAAYDASEIGFRQRASVFRLLSILNDEETNGVIQSLQSFAAQVPDIPPGSYYLARVAVAAPYRRSGVGTLLLKHFLGQGRDRLGYSLHVRSDNENAKSLYRRLGFSVLEPIASPYLVMYRR